MSIAIIVILFLYASYLTLEKYIVTGHIFGSHSVPESQSSHETAQSPEETPPLQKELVGESHFRIGQSGHTKTNADYSGQVVPQEVQHPNIESNLAARHFSPPQPTVVPVVPPWPQQPSNSGPGFERQHNPNTAINREQQLPGTLPEDSDFRAWREALLRHQREAEEITRKTSPGESEHPMSEMFPERSEIIGQVERENPHQATGVTFDDMEAVENALIRDDISPQKKEQAMKAFSRLEGTDMDRLMRASILGSSEKIKRYMDLYIGNEIRPLSRKTKESILDIFDIEEYV